MLSYLYIVSEKLAKFLGRYFFGAPGRDVNRHTMAVWCSGNALVSMNAVALHRARLVLGWVTAFGQVNCLIT